VEKNMPYQDFVDGLRELGYAVQQPGPNRVTFPFKIEVGKFAGTVVEIGYDVPGDFNLQAPGGPHLKPHLLPITGGGGAHPSGGVHASPFGAEWQYWSRPMHHWSTTARTVKDVIAFLNKLFDTQ
jgi:hypothetical protein